MQGQAGRGIPERQAVFIRRTDSRGHFKPDRTNQYIGLQIRTGRRLMGLPRSALAIELGIDVGTLASYEHGSRETPPSMMARIAGVLNKPLSWFSQGPATSIRLSAFSSPAIDRVEAPPATPPTVEPQIVPDSRPRVLLVDDASDVLVVLGAFIESAGLQVIKVSSGDEALKVVAGDLPLHAIVTDNVMPGLSGADLLLQAANLRPDVPGLIITGNGKDANGLSELPKTISVLSKPFRREELVSRIRAMTQAPVPTVREPVAAGNLEAMPSAERDTSGV